MPKQGTENVGHTSLTDHRILRNSSEVPAVLQSSSRDQDLIYDTLPPSSGQAPANLRNLALAYSQVAGRFPELSGERLELLQQAAAKFPDDAEIQAAYGLVLSESGPKEHDHAMQVLQLAINVGSKSPVVRNHLARLQMQDGHVIAAIELLSESIKIDPYDTAPYHNLAYAYSMSTDDAKAMEVLDNDLQIDPADDVARRMLLEIRSSSEKK